MSLPCGAMLGCWKDLSVRPVLQTESTEYGLACSVMAASAHGMGVDLVELCRNSLCQSVALTQLVNYAALM